MDRKALIISKLRERLSARARAKRILNVIRTVLDDALGWSYDCFEKKMIIQTGVRLRSRLRMARIIIDVKEGSYLVYTISPIGGMPGKFKGLMEFLSRLNYGLMNGNFELDYNDGEVRYKTFVNLNGVHSVSIEVILDSILMGCQMMDAAGDGLAAIALGSGEADVEARKVESRLQKLQR